MFGGASSHETWSHPWVGSPLLSSEPLEAGLDYAPPKDGSVLTYGVPPGRPCDYGHVGSRERTWGPRDPSIIA